jgi:transcriptional regulator with XRE-family HTH domain
MNALSYPVRMGEIRFNWYLRDWLKTLNISQQALADSLDWQKSKVSRLASGTSDWSRGHLDEISSVLHLEPFELLLHPEDAMAMRRLRDTAVRIASDRTRAWRDDANPEPLPTRRAS